MPDGRANRHAEPGGPPADPGELPAAARELLPAVQVPGWLVQAELLPAWRELVRVPERAVRAEAGQAGSEQPEPALPAEAVQQYAVH